MKTSIRIIVIISILTSAFCELNAATYYLRYFSSGSAQNPGSWSTGGIWGGGTSASSFETSGDVFVVSSGINANFNNNSVLFGEGVTIQLNGNARSGNSGTLTINGEIIFTSSSQYTAGAFLLGPSGKLTTANQSGLVGSSGSLSTGGSKTVYTTSNYEFNGANQSTYGMPTNCNNITFSGSGTKSLYSTLTINGIMSLQGTASFTNNGQVLNYGAASTIEYKGTNSRTTGTEFPQNFSGSGGVIIDQGDGNTVTLNQSKTAINGIIHVKSGNFDLDIYTINRTSSGGSLTLNDNATLKIGGTNTLPTNYSTHSIAATSTIEYSGTTQTISTLNSSQQYGNLHISGTGTKTFPGSAITVRGNLIMFSSVSIAGEAMTINGNVDIQSAATFQAGSYTHNVGDNWTKNGTFVSSGTINFNGSTAQQIGASNFYNISFSSGGTKTAIGALSIANALTINTGSNFSAGNFTHTITGNWTNNGSFTAGTGTISFIESGAKTISGTASTTFYNLTINSSSGVSLGINTQNTGLLTLTSGLLTLGDYNMTTGTVTDGSSGSYVKTDGTGRFIRNMVANNTSFRFPVGNSAFNPVTLQANATGSGNSDYYAIRVADEAISNSNDQSKTIARKWFIKSSSTGVTSLVVKLQYNSLEAESNFRTDSTAYIGYYGGYYWGYAPCTVSGTELTTTGTVPDMTSDAGFFAIGSGMAFKATKLAVVVRPPNPTKGVNSSTVTVTAKNSQNVSTVVTSATGFELTSPNSIARYSASNPSLPLKDTIEINTLSAELGYIAFNESTWNTDSAKFLSTATVTATAKTGEGLAAGTSAGFKVLDGAIYRPKTSGNWDTLKWEKSVNGGGTFTLVDPTVYTFTETDIVQIPLNISVNVNQNVSLNSLLIEGTLNIVSGSTLTLNHSTSDLNDYNLHVHGTLKNSGGTFINSNESYPIEVHGGTYWHARDGGSIPVANWYEHNGVHSTCKIDSIKNNAVSGLNQSFENFIWDNASQTVTQTLTSNLTVEQDLTLKNGKITTDTYKVIHSAEGALSVTNGYIVGNFRKYVPNTTNPTVTLPVGDTGTYAPVSITFTGSISGSGYLDSYTTQAQPPRASGLNQTNYVNRKWTITNTAISGFTSYSPTFTFASADKVGSPDYQNFVVSYFSDSHWAVATAGTRTELSTQATGLDHFTDFYVGESDCSSTFAVWFGGTNTDWHTASNWCNNSVPSSSVDVLIPAGISNYPVISQNASAKNLEIESGANLTLNDNYTLSVYGNIYNQGTFDIGAATVAILGSSQQTISGNNTFYNLTINNNAGVIAANDLTIDNNINLLSANANSTTGALKVNSGYTLYLNHDAKVTGNGDITGTITREHTFHVNESYTFTNEKSYIRFNTKSGQTLPSRISLNLSIGTAPTWTGKPAIAREYSIAQVGASNTDAVIMMTYLQTEVPETLNESKLSIWSNAVVGEATVVTEQGAANYNESENYISLNSVNFAAFPSALDNFYVTYSETSASIKTWNGNDNSNWNEPANWTPAGVPDNVGVIIPDAATTTNDPNLPADTAIVKLIILQKDAVLNAESNAIMRITGTGNVWSTESGAIFNPGNSTIEFYNNEAPMFIAGNSVFHNITIYGGVKLNPAEYSNVKISGQLNNYGIFNAAETHSTVEYNGSATQTIINPNGPLSGYHDLILSGTGTKVLPEALHIRGDLTINATMDALTQNSTVEFNSTLENTIQNISGNTGITFNNLTINNQKGAYSESDITVNGILNLANANMSATEGTLNIPADTLTMGAQATTTGIGEVSGYIKRTSFVTGLFYSFGNKNTGIRFNTGSKLPSRINIRALPGVQPAWKTNAILRTNDPTQTGSDNTSIGTVRNAYLDSELNGINEKDLSQFVHNIPLATSLDKGRTSYNLTENWVEITNVNISQFSGSFNQVQQSLGASTVETRTWNGSVSTDWGNQYNWTPTGVPSTSTNVVIPSGTAYSPTLPSSATTELRRVTIEAGATLNGGTSSELILTGGQGTWSNNGGTFNPGTSTVKFTNSGATLSGSTDFYNFSIDKDTTVLTIAEGTNIRIAGTATNAGTGYAAGPSTVEFNGGNQQVVLPDNTLKMFYNLILSGTGTKTLPAEAFTVYGNMKVEGSTTVSATHAVNVMGNLEIESGATLTANGLTNKVTGTFVNRGTYSLNENAALTLEGNFANHGTFNQSNGTVIFGGTNTQSIEGTEASGFNDLDIRNAAGVVVASDDSVNVKSYLKVRNAARLIINNGRQLNAQKIVNQAGANGILIKSNINGPNGTLIFYNHNDSTVQATVEMYTKAYVDLNLPSGSQYKWQYFGIPVRSLAANPTFYGSYLRQFSETTGTWTQLNNSSVLLPFNGYQITQTTPKTINFQGELVNQTQTRLLSYTATSPYKGQHILSNPFTAAVDINDIVFGENMDPTVYLYNTGSYADWNTNKGTIADTDNENPGQYIAAPKITAGTGGIPGQLPSMQGFLVRGLVDADRNFTLPYVSAEKNSARQRVKKSEDFVYSIVEISSERFVDRMWLFSDPRLSKGYNGGWDGYKFMGSTITPQIYGRYNTSSFQVHAVDDYDNTELGFRPGEESTYQLKFTHHRVDEYYPQLYLIDLFENKTTDITQSGSVYEFTALPGDVAATRFRIVRSPEITTGNANDKISGVHISYTNGILSIINNTNDKGLVELYDTSGRLLGEYRYSAKSISTYKLSVSPGSYFARTQHAGKSENTKIVVLE
ncbi:MAG: T9SS type A sorting domain-containing protein [Paludibacter sp.]|nr:T9SS type A sorting domain-containing protein [Paludibacter sp.]